MTVTTAPGLQEAAVVWLAAFMMEVITGRPSSSSLATTDLTEDCIIDEEIVFDTAAVTGISAVTATPPNVDVTRTVWAVELATLYAISRPFDVPAAMLVTAGTRMTALALLVLLTFTALDGAAFRFTAQINTAPASNGFGEQLSDTGLSRSIVSVAEVLDAPRVAVTVAVAAAAVSDAVAVNVLELEPSATVMLLGTTTDDVLLAIAIAAPPAGATPDSVTMQVVLVPPIRNADGQSTRLILIAVVVIVT